jgi:hypothetical protein
MSITPVNTANVITPAAAVAPKATSHATAPTASSTTSGNTTAARDTVEISAAARSAAQQEASETPGQTLKEAASGDHVAKARLARHVP